MTNIQKFQEIISSIVSAPVKAIQSLWRGRVIHIATAAACSYLIYIYRENIRNYVAGFFPSKSVDSGSEESTEWTWNEEFRMNECTEDGEVYLWYAQEELKIKKSDFVWNEEFGMNEYKGRLWDGTLLIETKNVGWNSEVGMREYDNFLWGNEIGVWVAKVDLKWNEKFGMWEYSDYLWDKKSWINRSEMIWNGKLKVHEYKGRQWDGKTWKASPISQQSASASQAKNITTTEKLKTDEPAASAVGIPVPPPPPSGEWKPTQSNTDVSQPSSFQIGQAGQKDKPKAKISGSSIRRITERRAYIEPDEDEETLSPRSPSKPADSSQNKIAPTTPAGQESKGKQPVYTTVPGMTVKATLNGKEIPAQITNVGAPSEAPAEPSPKGNGWGFLGNMVGTVRSAAGRVMGGAASQNSSDSAASTSSATEEPVISSDATATGQPVPASQASAAAKPATGSDATAIGQPAPASQTSAAAKPATGSDATATGQPVLASQASAAAKPATGSDATATGQPAPASQASAAAKRGTVVYKPAADSDAAPAAKPASASSKEAIAVMGAAPGAQGKEALLLSINNGTLIAASTQPAQLLSIAGKGDVKTKPVALGSTIVPPAAPAPAVSPVVSSKAPETAAPVVPFSPDIFTREIGKAVEISAPWSVESQLRADWKGRLQPLIAEWIPLLFNYEVQKIYKDPRLVGYDFKEWKECSEALNELVGLNEQLKNDEIGLKRAKNYCLEIKKLILKLQQLDEQRQAALNPNVLKIQPLLLNIENLRVFCKQLQEESDSKKISDLLDLFEKELAILKSRISVKPVDSLTVNARMELSRDAAEQFVQKIKIKDLRDDVGQTERFRAAIAQEVKRLEKIENLIKDMHEHLPSKN